MRFLVCGFFSLLAIAACGDSGPGSTLRISPRHSVTDPAALGGLVVGVQGREFRAEELGGMLVVPAPDAGELTIQIQLFQDEAVVAEGDFGWEMQESYEWTVDIYRQVTDPSADCIGCGRAESFAITEAAQNAPGESLWVVLSGQRKGSGVIY